MCAADEEQHVAVCAYRVIACKSSYSTARQKYRTDRERAVAAQAADHLEILGDNPTEKLATKALWPRPGECRAAAGEQSTESDQPVARRVECAVGVLIKGVRDRRLADENHSVARRVEGAAVCAKSVNAQSAALHIYEAAVVEGYPDADGRRVGTGGLAQQPGIVDGGISSVIEEVTVILDVKSSAVVENTAQVKSKLARAGPDGASRVVELAAIDRHVACNGQHHVRGHFNFTLDWGPPR